MFKFTKSWRICVAMTGTCVVLLQTAAAQHHESMSPEDVIATLPYELQSRFERMTDDKRDGVRAIIEAEMDMLRSLRGTLEETKLFLMHDPSDGDRKAVANALRFFHQHDKQYSLSYEMDNQDPMGGPGMGPGGGPGIRLGGDPGPGHRFGPPPGHGGGFRPPPGHGGDPGPGHRGDPGPDDVDADDVDADDVDAEDMVKWMIEKVERKIQHLEEELEDM